MENRRKCNERLVRWITEYVRSEYPEDISLVCVYGSFVNGTMNSLSDVDCYFVPRTQRGYDLAQTFILEGVGYDIYPVPWQRLEDIAELKAGMQPLVGDVRIIYSAGREDELRFRALQEKLQENLSRDDIVRAAALAGCWEAASLLAMAQLEQEATQAWKIAGFVVMTLAEALMISNHDYFHFGLKCQYRDLQRLPGIPAAVVEGYRGVICSDSPAQAIRRAGDFLELVCVYLGVTVHAEPLGEHSPAAAQMDAQVLAEIYQEICSTFNKIYVCCGRGDSVLAFLSAVCLQRDLDECVAFGGPRLSLLPHFRHDALAAFEDETHRAEEELVRCIRENGGQIRAYDDFEAFERAQRCK